MRFVVTLIAILFGLMLGASALSFRADIPVEELKAKYGGEPSQYAEIGGMKVHYRDEGTGPVVVLVHGSNASLHTWEGWTANLKDNFRVIRMDLPGHGLTGPDPESRYRVADFVSLVDALMVHLEVQSFAIGGNSLGGAVAWNYAVRYPDKVEKLILVDAAGYPWEEPLPLVLRLAGTPVIGQMMSVISPRFGIRDSIYQVYGDPSRVTEELVTRYHELLLREGNRNATYIRFSQGFSFGNVDKIPSISVPTLILWGTLDTWILPKYGERFHQDIANSELRIYANLGHVPMEEDPLSTVSDVRTFLEALPE
jgi:pimeloyl-ACP methyl ester carboxylesterase